jgi:hypothetical protein
MVGSTSIPQTRWITRLSIRIIWLIQLVRFTHHPSHSNPKPTNGTKQIDTQILLQGLKLARKLGQTSPLASSLTNETSPGTAIQSDEDWLDWLRNEASTEFHPSSSCAMLPREKGGVVDAKLRVYGLSNVRVADASVPPIALSTHLMASTYGVAELASALIRDYWNGLGDGDGKGDGGEVSPAFSAQSSTVSAAAAAQTTKKNGVVTIAGGGWAGLMVGGLHVVFAIGLFA